MFSRYWINQPSTLQPGYRMHGLNVLAPADLSAEGEFVTVYFISGPVVSCLCPKLALSPGWNSIISETFNKTGALHVIE